MTAAYWGCRSWVDLQADDAVPTTESTPAMAPAALHRTIARVHEAFA